MNTVWSKKIHNWFGMASALFLTVLLVTGILLNHPSWFKSKETDAVAFDPAHPERIFAGREDGFFLSQDSGRTWVEVAMLYSPQNVAAIVFDPRDSHKIFVLEKWGKIFSSEDGGRVWKAIALPFDAQTLGIELKSLSVGPEGKLLLFTSNGYLVSNNSGAQWEYGDFNPQKKSVKRLILTLHNGYFFGPSFVWVYDFSAASLFILIVTGLVLWKSGKKII